MTFLITSDVNPTLKLMTQQSINVHALNNMSFGKLF